MANDLNMDVLSQSIREFDNQTHLIRPNVASSKSTDLTRLVSMFQPNNLLVCIPSNEKQEAINPTLIHSGQSITCQTLPPQRVCSPD